MHSVEFLSGPPTLDHHDLQRLLTDVHIGALTRLTVLRGAEKLEIAVRPLETREPAR